MKARYYTSMEYFKRKFDRLSGQMRLEAGDVEEFAGWKDGLRKELAFLLGIHQMESCALNSAVVEAVDTGEFRREKVILETEPGIFMPLYVLIPPGVGKGHTMPAVIAAHGHSSGGKLSIAGIKSDPAVEEAIDRYHYDYGVDFVRKGLIVFCPDARGFGERREKSSQGDSGEQVLKSSCFVLNNMAIPLGMTVTGMWVWDLMRLIDYIETRPDCSGDAIGCAGLSGGGLQTLWLAALDDRVSSAVVSGYFYGYKKSLLEMPDGCSCNYVPHLWEKVDMGDIGALIAPRPLLVETGDRDELNGEDGLSNVYPQVETTRRAYGLFGKENLFLHHVFHAGHRWSGERGIDFLCEHLLSS